jgi:hypothetical protein
MFFLVASFVLEKRPKEKGSANYGCGSATDCVNLLYTKTACQQTSVREFCRLNIGNFKQYFAAIEPLSFVKSEF